MADSLKEEKEIKNEIMTRRITKLELFCIQIKKIKTRNYNNL